MAYIPLCDPQLYKKSKIAKIMYFWEVASNLLIALLDTGILLPSKYW